MKKEEEGERKRKRGKGGRRKKNEGRTVEVGGKRTTESRELNEHCISKNGV